jgi:hypothetical protein
MRFGISQALFALVITTGSIASASAQEAPAGAPAPPAEPETLDSAARDPNVSTIHGQLVPVGDKNQYQIAFKPWNVSLNPLGAMMGFYSASASYGVTQNLALRVDGSYYSPVGSETTGFEVGVGVPIYLRRTYQGAFVEPGFIARELEHHDGDFSSTDKEIGPQVLLGWHWSWDSGLNAAIAFGAGRNLAHEENADGSSSNGSDMFVNGYLRIGYEF